MCTVTLTQEYTVHTYVVTVNSESQVHMFQVIQTGVLSSCTYEVTLNKGTKVISSYVESHFE